MIDRDTSYHAHMVTLLSDTLDQARRNFFKATSQVIIGCLIIVFVAFADHPILGMTGLIADAETQNQSVFCIAKGVLLLGAGVYTFISMFHVAMALFQIMKARLLWRRIDHE